MRSVTPALATAATESPPPMTVVPVTAATACATAIVPRERVDLEDAHRPVPDDGPRTGDDGAINLHCLGSDVEPHPIADRRVADFEHFRRGAGLDFGRDHVIDRQFEPDPALLRAPFDVARRIQEVVLDERLAHGDAAGLRNGMPSRRR